MNNCIMKLRVVLNSLTEVEKFRITCLFVKVVEVELKVYREKVKVFNFPRFPHFFLLWSWHILRTVGGALIAL